MLTTALSFIVTLGVLIFIHELGHFIVAKRVGIRVEKFSLGFPPNIFSKQVGETTYCIGVIPLGGYVKMIGENPDEESTGAPYEFMSKTILQRAAVIFAGPFMNYILALVLFTSLFLRGTPVVDPDHVIVGSVEKSDPAYKAGLQEGDQIIAVDGKPTNSFDSVRIAINSKIMAPVHVTWLRGNDTLQADITTRLEAQPNATGGMDSIGVIGFSQKIQRYESGGILEACKHGFITTHTIVWETVKFVKKLVTGQVSPKLLGGPLFIAQQSGKEASKGVASLIFFMALLSVNLAVLNVLPIPVLDGGHLLFLAIERVRGTPLSMKARAMAQQVGIVFLFGVILLVTYNDILRMFR
jgi:regulator of sigma E protease